MSKQDVYVGTNLDAAVYQQLKDMAKRNHRSLSAEVRLAVDERLERENRLSAAAA